MDLSVFYEVVVPLLEMGNSTLIMISTPVESFNFFSGLLELKDPDTGQHVALVFDCELICKRCKTKAKPTDCTHMLKFVPPWKSVEKQKSVKLLLKDNQSILQRESMGVVSDDGASLIEKRYIQNFIARTPWKPVSNKHVPWLVVCLDPNTTRSKNSNETAIAAIFIHEGRRVVRFSNNNNLQQQKIFLIFIITIFFFCYTTTAAFCL